jgi:hypothetical protein
MTAESLIASCSAALLLLVGYAANTSATSASVGPANAQITVLYDAFGCGLLTRNRVQSRVCEFSVGGWIASFRDVLQPRLGLPQSNCSVLEL